MGSDFLKKDISLFDDLTITLKKLSLSKIKKKHLKHN